MTKLIFDSINCTVSINVLVSRTPRLPIGTASIETLHPEGNRVRTTWSVIDYSQAISLQQAPTCSPSTILLAMKCRLRAHHVAVSDIEASLNGWLSARGSRDVLTLTKVLCSKSLWFVILQFSAVLEDGVHGPVLEDVVLGLENRNCFNCDSQIRGPHLRGWVRGPRRRGPWTIETPQTTVTRRSLTTR